MFYAHGCCFAKNCGYLHDDNNLYQGPPPKSPRTGYTPRTKAAVAAAGGAGAAGGLKGCQAVIEEEFFSENFGGEVNQTGVSACAPGAVSPRRSAEDTNCSTTTPSAPPKGNASAEIPASTAIPAGTGFISAAVNKVAKSFLGRMATFSALTGLKTAIDPQACQSLLPPLDGIALEQCSADFNCTNAMSAMSHYRGEDQGGRYIDWLDDSGAGAHLIGEDLLVGDDKSKIRETDHPLAFATAGGTRESHRTIGSDSRFGPLVSYVMQSRCPPAMAQGRLIEQGYGRV